MKKSKLPIFVQISAALFFAPFVVALILLCQQQWGPGREILLSTASSLVFIGSTVGWGMAVKKRLPGIQKPQVESLVISLMLGMFSIYGLSLIAGLLGIFRPHVFLAVHAIGLMLFFLWRKDVRLPAIMHWKSSERLLLLLTMFALGCQVVTGWTPLFFYDSLVYHLYAPSEFFKAGSLIYLPLNLYTNTPLAIQLTTGTTLAFDSSGQTFKLVLTFLGCLVPLSLALYLWEQNRIPALMAALLAAVYPGVWIPQALGTIDIPLAAFLVLGAYWYRSALVTNNKTLAILSGIALGFVAASRYQGLILIALILLVLSLKKWKPALLLTTSVSIFLMVMPWLCRNFFNTGNPIYPLASSDQVDLEALNRDVLGPSFGSVSTIQKVLAPFALLLLNPPNRLFGLILLFAGILALTRYRESDRLSSAALLGFLGLLCWAFLHPVPGSTLFRFNAASLMFLIAAASGVLFTLFGRMAAHIAILLSALFFYFSIQDVTSAMPVVRSITNENVRTGLVQSNVPGFSAFNFCNEKPSSGKVFLLGETRGFCVKNSPCIASSVFDSPHLIRFLQAESSPQKWTENLKRAGVDRILISIPEWRRLQAKGYLPLANFQKRRIIQWLQQQAVEFNDGHDTVVVSLKR